jgi:hypothetical protein
MSQKSSLPQVIQSVSRVLMPDRLPQVSFLKSRADVALYGGKDVPSVFVEGVDPVALFAWLTPGEFLKQLEAEITDAGDDDRALTREQRKAKDDELAREILLRERIEEALVTATPGALRRRDVDLRALLHLSDDAPSSGAVES